MNRANLGFQMTVNHLADHTELELKALRGKQYTHVTNNGGLPFPYKPKKIVKTKSFPKDLDWRLYGAVTPVKGKFQEAQYIL